MPPARWPVVSIQSFSRSAISLSLRCMRQLLHAALRISARRPERGSVSVRRARAIQFGTEKGCSPRAYRSIAINTAERRRTMHARRMLIEAMMTL